mmetsp:Transcript_17243/g.46068  ORF Transcript_17243/g.46068 Transcript_17243/m.46068 type:complete len:185 (+) Transcript_17243:132-686(+)
MLWTFKCHEARLFFFEYVLRLLKSKGMLMPDLPDGKKFLSSVTLDQKLTTFSSAVEGGDGMRLQSMATEHETGLIKALAEASKLVFGVLTTPEALAVTWEDHAKRLIAGCLNHLARFLDKKTGDLENVKAKQRVLLAHNGMDRKDDVMRFIQEMATHPDWGEEYNKLGLWLQRNIVFDQAFCDR